MKKILLMLCVASFAASAVATESGWSCQANVGYAITRKTGLTNPDSTFWHVANEGYDAKLGQSSFVGVSVGKDVCRWCAVDVDYTLYQTFNYQKYQTGGSGPNRMRFFDIGHQAALFNLQLKLPEDWALSIAGVNVSPVLGAGLGVGISRMSNFHSVGYIDIAIASATGVGTSNAIGMPNTKADLAWQVNGGLMLQPEDSDISVGVNYRYYDGGKFESGTSFMFNSVAATEKGAQVTAAAWKANLRMHQVRLCLNWEF
jgi:hypothetical protein